MLLIKRFKPTPNIKLRHSQGAKSLLHVFHREVQCENVTTFASIAFSTIILNLALDLQICFALTKFAREKKFRFFMFMLVFLC